MGLITTELVESKRDGRGRRITPAAQREALLRAYEQSGLTQQAFTRREGIKYPTLVSWLRRRGPRRPPGAAFAEVTLPAAAGLEVRLPDGVVIRGAKLEEVAQLLRLLRC